MALRGFRRAYVERVLKVARPTSGKPESFQLFATASQKCIGGATRGHCRRHTTVGISGA